MADAFTAGARVADRYLIDKHLGEGAFGEVFRALDQNLAGRPVAVKVLHDEMTRYESVIERFETEALALAHLQHPNIVNILDRGSWKGRRFQVCEYVDGKTLGAWLDEFRARGAAPTLDEVRAVFDQLCAGVDAAHKLEQPGPIVHRDIKPGNVMLRGADDDLHVKVLDFGVAQLGASHMTRTGVVLGTPFYMSPEQMMGRSKDVTPASDVFSLAIVLVEMLVPAGILGEEETWWAESLRDEEATIARVAKLRPDVPAEVGRVIGYCLRRQRERRYGSAGQLRRALRDAWKGKEPDAPVEGRPGSGRASATGPNAAVRLSDPGASGQRNVDATLLQMPESLASSIAAATPPASPRVDAITIAAKPEGSTLQPLVEPPRPPSRPEPRSPTVLAGGAAAFALLGGIAVYFVTRTPAAPTPPPKPSAAAVHSAPSASASNRPALAPANPCPEGMVLVAGGDAWIGSPPGVGRDEERPQHQVKLEPFCMDRTEVTVAAYQQCTAAGRCGPAPTEPAWLNIAEFEKQGWKKLCNGGRPDRTQHPLNCIDYDSANAYCAWHGGAAPGKLPNESQWEWAARGEKLKKHAWGEEPPDATRANACGKECAPRVREWGLILAFIDSAGDSCDPSNGGDCQCLPRQVGLLKACDAKALYDADDGHPQTAPVGSFTKGDAAALADLSGNVWEWTSGAYAPYPGGAAFPVPPPDQSMTVRGGGFLSGDANELRAAMRKSARKSDRHVDLGFRCIVPAK
jgi:eukaryotic-like serine/threonine-protein kinase